MQSIEELVLAHHAAEAPPEALITALMAREDEIADALRLAGQQYGVYPQIVAEVFAEVGIGSPVPEPQRSMIHSQYVQLMEAFRRAYEQGEPPPPSGPVQ